MLAGKEAQPDCVQNKIEVRKNPQEIGAAAVTTRARWMLLIYKYFWHWKQTIFGKIYGYMDVQCGYIYI